MSDTDQFRDGLEPDVGWEPDNPWPDEFQAGTPRPAANGNTHPAEPVDPLPFVDWATFWNEEHHEDDWLYDDVLARGRGHAIYAGHKAGKSLFVLWLVVQMIRHPQLVVIYCDYEMTRDDLHERLSDMGCGPGTDLSRLYYWLLPALGPLDTIEGSDDFVALIDRVAATHPDAHICAVIDTTGRAVRGEENSADTIRNFYRCTGLRLKQRGITWLRLDHSGKDTTRGQRGSSAKGDDVDIVWKLTAAEGAIELRREASRVGWCPEKVTFAIRPEPLRYQRTGDIWPAGTKDTAALLEDLGIPAQESVRAAQAALRGIDQGRRLDIIGAAQRWRRQQAEEGHR